MGNRFKHLSWNDRLKIEILLKAGHSQRKISELIGVHESTISRELRRGRYIHRNSNWTEEERYSPEQAHEKYEQYLKEKGRRLKIGNDWEFVRYIEEKILQNKCSPYAALENIRREKKEFQTKICLSTLYNYIRSNLFPNIELKDLPYKRTVTGKKKKKVQKRATKGTSIERRPEEILSRQEPGHWEMDTVKGAQGVTKKSLLVLTERVTRIEIAELMPDGTAESVVRVLNKLERTLGEKKFRNLFKTITVDNGSEFSDFQGLERSRRNKRKRTNVYYCHPSCPSERGSNEKQNTLIRRHIPKGTDLDQYSQGNIREIEQWTNEYPRKLFEGRSSLEVYEEVFQEPFWRAAM